MKGRVDVRRAAGFVVRSLNLDVSLSGTGPLTVDEAKRLREALDSFTPEAIDHGVTETIYTLAADVLFLAITEEPTTAGEHPRLALSFVSGGLARRMQDAATTARVNRLAAEAEARAHATNPKFRPSKRSPDGVSRRALRRRLRDLVYAIGKSGYGAKQGTRATVYVLFLLGGQEGLAAVVEDEPRDDDNAVTYTARCASRIEDMIRDREGAKAPRR